MEIALIITTIFIAFFFVYCVLPNYYARNISKSVKRNINKNGKNIALTFDDGPHNIYTNDILDILKENNIKATFFVVINNVNKNVDIIKRMIDEGHQIELHSYKHKGTWQMFPLESVKEINVSKKILRDRGINVKYYRPPWGTFNLFSLYTANKNGLQTILWTIEANDWKKDNSPENISNIIIEKARAGDVIVLHDSGGAMGAPLNTIGALKIFVPKLLDEGYSFVTIEEGLK